MRSAQILLQERRLISLPSVCFAESRSGYLNCFIWEVFLLYSLTCIFWLFDSGGHELGWREVPTHDSEVQDAANHAVKTIQQGSNSLFLYELLEVKHARAEWVMGFLSFWHRGEMRTTRARLAPWHVFVGLYTYALAVATKETGLLRWINFDFFRNDDEACDVVQILVLPFFLCLCLATI